MERGTRRLTLRVGKFVAVLTVAALPGIMSALPASACTCNGYAATICGTDGADSITGTDNSEDIAALGGDDGVDAKGGSDVVCGGPGNDSITGGDGNDWLYGQGGHDKLDGQAGFQDINNGGPGQDRCVRHWLSSNCEVFF